MMVQLTFYFLGGYRLTSSLFLLCPSILGFEELEWGLYSEEISSLLKNKNFSGDQLN